jgi:hypothetical protein
MEAVARRRNSAARLLGRRSESLAAGRSGSPIPLPLRIPNPVAIGAVNSRIRGGRRGRHHEEASYRRGAGNRGGDLRLGRTACVRGGRGESSGQWIAHHQSWGSDRRPLRRLAHEEFPEAVSSRSDSAAGGYQWSMRRLSFPKIDALSGKTRNPTRTCAPPSRCGCRRTRLFDVSGLSHSVPTDAGLASAH